jgi:hypothetical protein
MMMNHYCVEVWQDSLGQWDPMTGFDQNNPDQVIWQATERLTRKEAEERLALLTGKAPNRRFRIAQIPIAL